jgi:hypothetical protein
MKKNTTFKNVKLQSSPIKLTIHIAFIYFITLAGTITCLVVNPYSFEGKDGMVHYPQIWIYMLGFMYYVLPFILGIVFGASIRPFWKNFRNLVVLIFAVHFFYSFLIYSGRWYLWNEKYGKSATESSSGKNISAMGNKIFAEHKEQITTIVVFLSRWPAFFRTISWEGNNKANSDGNSSQN